MVFSSRIFLFVFLPIALLVYFVTPRRFRRVPLLVISLVFYGWAGLDFLLVLAGCTLIDFAGGWLTGSLREEREKLAKIVIGLSVAGNLLLLAYFKYFNFFMSSVNGATGLDLPLRQIILPLGISFYVFGGISYLLDVNSGKIGAEKNFLSFALFMSFFPKMMQGPIERYGNLSRQIAQSEPSSERFARGAFRFVLGMSKKVLIADPIGLMVNQIYANPALGNSAAVAWLGAIGYTLQIFFDFSGYTDMAIGLANMLGFDLMENFNFPYIATSIGEFWRRWHISLSSWFRDYVFLPLEFKRRKQKVFRQQSNTLIVFFLTGLWHGASWNFVVWGLWHGLFIVFERVFNLPKARFKVPRGARWLITLLALIVGWVLFRSPNLGYAFDTLGVMFGAVKAVDATATLSWYLNPKLLLVLGAAILACVPWLQVFPKVVERYRGTITATLAQDASFVLLLAASIISVIASAYSSFIYFQF